MRAVPSFTDLAIIYVPGVAQLESIIAIGFPQIRRAVVGYGGKAIRLCCGTVAIFIAEIGAIHYARGTEFYRLSYYLCTGHCPAWYILLLRIIYKLGGQL